MSDLIFKNELPASEVLRSNFRDFARHTVKEYLANEIDGLKLVHRRILQSVNRSGNKYKEATLVGAVMGDFHPHGDGAIKESIDRLAQPFFQSCPLIGSDGNIGAYAGGSAAAMRYLDIYMHPFAEDIFFKYTNPKTLKYVPSEIDDNKPELSYFVPVIPTALIMGPSAISVAYRENIPYYNFTDVCNLVIEFIKEKKKHPIDYMKSYSKYAKYLIPDFPINGYILNARQVLEEYNKGNFDAKFVTCGTMDLNKDTINIHTIPFGTDFYKQVVIKLRELFKKPSFASANYTDVSNLVNDICIGNVELPLKRGNSPFNDLDKLKKEIKFQQNWTPIWNFSTPEGLLTERNPIELLKIWYEERYKNIMTDIKLTNTEVANEHRKICALLIIYDYAKEVADLFLSVDKPEDTIEPLCKKYGLSIYQAKFIASLKISQFTKLGRDELLQQKKLIEDKLKAIHDKFIHIDDLIIEQVKAVRDKYSNKIIQRRTRIPDFIGAIKINNDGYIQFSSLDEMDSLVKHWSGRANVNIVMYPNYSNVFNKQFNLYYQDKKVYESDIELDLHKQIASNNLYVVNKDSKFTIVHRKDNTIARLDGIQFINEKGTNVIHVGSKFTAVTQNWEVISVDTTSIPKRINIGSTGLKSEYLYVSPTVADHTEEVIVVSVNKKDANTVMFERVKLGIKMFHSLMSNTQILAIINPRDDKRNSKYTLIDIPDEILQRCSFKHLLMYAESNGKDTSAAYPSLLDFFGKDKRFTVSVFKKTSSNGIVNFKTRTKGSTILVPNV